MPGGRRPGRGVPLSTRYIRSATDSGLSLNPALLAQDSLTLSDAAAISVASIRATPLDSLSLLDAVVAQTGDIRTVSDALTLSDTATRPSASFQRAASDTLRIRDLAWLPIASSPASRGLLLRGVTGSRTSVSLSFGMGTTVKDVTMPFDLDQDDVSKSVALPFLLNGPAHRNIVMPFDLDGDVLVSVELPFSILDASTGTSGGYIIAPLLGWRDEA